MTQKPRGRAALLALVLIAGCAGEELPGTAAPTGGTDATAPGGAVPAVPAEKSKGEGGPASFKGPRPRGPAAW